MGDDRSLWGSISGPEQRLRDIERRIEKIELIEPAVLSDRVERLSKAVGRMTLAFYTLAAAMVGAAVTIALAVHHA